MARRGRELSKADQPIDDDFVDVVQWYWDRLHEPAEFPWAGSKYPPVRIGPTWQTTPDGYWLLPEATLGWPMLGWVGTRLQLKRNTPWRYTLEQARWLLWWYSLDEAGDFEFREGALQRMKGWGKDPLASTWAMGEAFGPCRFAEWDRDLPVALDCPEAWVQLAAVSQEQTKNTTRLFPQLVKPSTVAEYGIRIGKEYVYGLGDERMIQAVTSSASTLEGARSTAVLENEIQEWDGSNSGFDMAAVIDRNTTKSADGAARPLAIFNAPEPSADSVGMRTREAFDLALAGGSITEGLMYDSLEAPPEAPLTPDDAPDVLDGVKGDAVWLNKKRIVKSLTDTRNPPSRSRRYWYNQVVAAEDAWLDPRHIDLCVDSGHVIGASDPCVVFFDGSKSDDATAVVACRISDGHVETVGVWHRPPGARGEGWMVNRATVDSTVRDFVDSHKVMGLWADPSHTVDDETREPYWDSVIDGWHRDYGRKFRRLKADRSHSVMWDMVEPKHVEAFTAAAERFAQDIEETAGRPDGAAPAITIDDDPRLKAHLRNARRMPNRWGVSIWKGHRESPKKIDAAVCAVGARMMRREWLNRNGRKGGGKVL